MYKISKVKEVASQGVDYCFPPLILEPKRHFATAAIKIAMVQNQFFVWRN